MQEGPECENGHRHVRPANLYTGLHNARSRNVAYAHGRTGMVQDARGSAAGVHGYSSCNSFRAIHDIFGDVSRNPRDPTDKVGKS